MGSPTLSVTECSRPGLLSGTEDVCRPSVQVQGTGSSLSCRHQGEKTQPEGNA